MIVRAPWWLRAITPTGIFRLTDTVKAAELGMPSTEIASGRVFITFDDGPVPEATPWVLDTLDRFGVKATFFMVGENALRYPDLVREVCRRGHRVANHAHRHRPGFRSTIRTYLEDARLAEEAISVGLTKEDEETERCRIFRPPHGYIRLSQLAALRYVGYEVVLFDVVSRDFDPGLTPDEVVDNVLSSARDGSVIVFHDSIKAFPRLREALPRILSELCIMGNGTSVSAGDERG